MFLLKSWKSGRGREVKVTDVFYKFFAWENTSWTAQEKNKKLIFKLCDVSYKKVHLCKCTLSDYYSRYAKIKIFSSILHKMLHFLSSQEKICSKQTYQSNSIGSRTIRCTLTRRKLVIYERAFRYIPFYIKNEEIIRSQVKLVAYVAEKIEVPHFPTILYYQLDYIFL